MDDEQDLIRRAQRGDLQAFDLLVRRYEEVAFRAAFLVARDAHEAADAAQDAFLRAYHGLGSFKLGQPFRPWLVRIVTNQALNRLKAAERRTRTSQRYSQESTMMRQDPTLDKVITEREQGERLLEATGRLNADDRLLISLRYWLDLPEAEIAHVLNVPLGTVKSRLHRTLARLREIINADYADLKDLVA